MTIDKSLRKGSGMTRVRNVLKRDERIERLEVEDKWSEDSSPVGLPKVRVIKNTSGKKKKKKVKEEDEAAEE